MFAKIDLILYRDDVCLSVLNNLDRYGEINVLRRWKNVKA